MYYKKIIIIFFMVSLSIFGSVELMYQIFKDKVYGNALEYRISQIVNSELKEEEYDYAFFGSSISNGVLGANIHRYKDLNLINLTNVGASTLAGNLYLMEKLLEKTNVKKVFIGLPYHSFEFNLGMPKVWRQLVNTFDKEKHLNDYKYIDKNFTINTKPMIKRVFFIKNFINKYILKKEKYLFEMSMNTIYSDDIKNSEADDCELQKRIKKDIYNKGKRMSQYEISSLYSYYLSLVKKYEQEYGIAINIILEPLPHTQLKLVNDSYRKKIYKVLNENNITFYDMNEKTIYKDCMFRDATHLKEKFEYIYEYSIIKLLKGKVN